MNDGAAAVALDALLARLRDEDEAGSAYEDLRRRLVRYFRLHEPAHAEELADVAIDRLARRIGEGVEIANLAAYALGIARHVLLEIAARHARERRAEADPTAWPEAPEADVEAAEESAGAALALAALDACLDTLGAHARTLMLDYYAADGGERIRSRQRLAGRLGVTLNALRNRALRLREALEECVRARLAGDRA